MVDGPSIGLAAPLIGGHRDPASQGPRPAGRIPLPEAQETGAARVGDQDAAASHPARRDGRDAPQRPGLTAADRV